MDPSSAHHHHQEMSSQTLESMLVCTKQDQEKKPRPTAEQAQKCPRCDSTNTKFCYYNNYSLTQPRYFCKSCRRYWTKGGTLRNVPVGGGCRKNKRISSKRNQDQSLTNSPNNPISSLTPTSYDSSSDLSLAFSRLQKQANGNLGIEENDNMSMIYNNNHGNNIVPTSFLDTLRGGFLETPNGFQYQNLYYGNIIGSNDNNMGQVQNGEMGMNYDQEMNGGKNVKQEMCNIAREGENNRILWGFPWQINGEVNNMSDFEASNRGQNWNNTGFGGSSWHGLLNSPLM